MIISYLFKMMGIGFLISGAVVASQKQLDSAGILLISVSLLVVGDIFRGIFSAKSSDEQSATGEAPVSKP